MKNFLRCINRPGWIQNSRFERWERILSYLIRDGGWKDEVKYLPLKTQRLLLMEFGPTGQVEEAKRVSPATLRADHLILYILAKAFTTRTSCQEVDEWVRADEKQRKAILAVASEVAEIPSSQGGVKGDQGAADKEADVELITQVHELLALGQDTLVRIEEETDGFREVVRTTLPSMIIEDTEPAESIVKRFDEMLHAFRGKD